MSTKTANGKAKVDALRDDAAKTRAELGDTVETLAEKADAKTRPAKWAGAGAGVLAAAAAAVAGGLAWRRRRNTPRRRAERVWHALTARVPMPKRTPLSKRTSLVNRFR